MARAYVPAELRVLVRQRAADACEYCLVPEAYSFFSHEIDHIIAVQHGGETAAGNLALACFLCNKHKGTNLTSIDPATGQVTRLFSPRHDDWQQHFYLSGDRIEPLTAEGRATARLLQFNGASRVFERKLLIAARVYWVPGSS